MVKLFFFRIKSQLFSALKQPDYDLLWLKVLLTSIMLFECFSICFTCLEDGERGKCSVKFNLSRVPYLVFRILVSLWRFIYGNLICFSSSFVSEHIETLEEIDMEYKHLALESGIENWGRVPALNCKSSFIVDLADAVVEALPSAMALSPNRSSTDADDHDPFRYAFKLLFGSILAFILLLSPKAFLAFRNNFI